MSQAFNVQTPWYQSSLLRLWIMECPVGTPGSTYDSHSAITTAKLNATFAACHLISLSPTFLSLSKNWKKKKIIIWTLWNMNAFIWYVYCYIIVSCIAEAVQVSHLTLSHSGMIHYRVLLGLICNAFTIFFFFLKRWIMFCCGSSVCLWAVFNGFLKTVGAFVFHEAAAAAQKSVGASDWEKYISWFRHLQHINENKSYLLECWTKKCGLIFNGMQIHYLVGHRFYLILFPSLLLSPDCWDIKLVPKPNAEQRHHHKNNI